MADVTRRGALRIVSAAGLTVAGAGRAGAVGRGPLQDEDPEGARPLPVPGELVNDAEAGLIATRQALSFLRPAVAVGLEGADVLGEGPIVTPTKRAFRLQESIRIPIPEVEGRLGPFGIEWKTREIYDIDGRLLYRDKFLDQEGGTEFRVRTAARDLLRTPVWSVKAGPKLDIEGLRDRAIKFAGTRAEGRLEPIRTGDDELVRLVCYSYPKLGILCTTVDDPGARVILDIGDLRVIPVNAFADQQTPESVDTVWSPFDTVTRATIGEFRETWERNSATLPELPEAGASLNESVEQAREKAITLERSISPDLTLVGQQTNVFCAVATALMILRHHGIEKTQDEIADHMNTGPSGTTNPDQVLGYLTLTRDTSRPLEAFFDGTASFSEAVEEINSNRPFKSGVPGHARACSGYRIDENGREFLYILDPWPPGQGDIYYEDWSAIFHTNYIYVRPRLSS